MGFRRFVGAALAAATVALAGCGPVKGKYSVEIRQTPAKIYTWLHDPAKLKQWLGGFKESRPLTEGGFRVGARSIDVIEMPEGKYELETEILAAEPGKLLKVRISAPEGFDGVSTYTLEDVGGTTRLTHESVTELKHWMANLMLPLWWPDAEKKMKADLAKLKELAERDS